MSKKKIPLNSSIYILIRFLLFSSFQFSNRRIRTKEHIIFSKSRSHLFKRRPIHNSKILEIQFENKIWNEKNSSYIFDSVSLYKIILLVPLFIQSRVACVKPPPFSFFKKIFFELILSADENLELKLLLQFFVICFCIKIQSRFRYLPSSQSWRRTIS